MATKLIPLLGPVSEQMLTVQTLDGERTAHNLLPELTSCLAPRDLPRTMAWFFDSLRPRALLLVETELWPVQLWMAQRRRVPVCVVNARISDRTFGWYQRALPLFFPLMAGMTALCRSEEDRARFIRMGVDPSRACAIGDLKLLCYEGARIQRPVASELLKWLEAEPVVILTCPTPTELSAVLCGHAELRQQGSAGRLLIAPRHPKRRGQVPSLAEFEHRSTLKPDDMPSVLVLDSLGELAGLFPYAAGVLMGGTWTGSGGHSMLDAARSGGWVVYGPRASAVEQQRALLEQAGIGLLQTRLDIRWSRVLEMLYRTGQDRDWRRSRCERFQQVLSARAVELETVSRAALGRFLEAQ